MDTSQHEVYTTEREKGQKTLKVVAISSGFSVADFEWREFMAIRQ